MDMEVFKQFIAGLPSRATNEQKEEAIQAILDGKTVAAAARQVDFARATVDRWWKAYLAAERGEEPAPKPPRRKSADDAATAAAKEDEAPAPKRPKGTTPEQDKALAKFVKKNPGVPIQMAISASGFPGGVQTAMKRLKQAKVKYVGPKEMQRRSRRDKVKTFLFMNALASGDMDTLKFVRKMK